MDLLVAVAPLICKQFPNVKFIIGKVLLGAKHRCSFYLSLVQTGGDGPKMIDLLQMRERHSLQDRIELLGSVKPTEVRNVGLFVPPRVIVHRLAIHVI